MIYESPFDKSVGCVCTQSIYKKIGTPHWLTTICILMSLVGCIMNISYYNNPSRVDPNINKVGLILHFVSLGLSLLLTSYIGRYFSGLQHDENNNTNDIDYNYHYLLGYILGSMYMFFTLLVYLPCIASNWSTNKPNMTIINGLSEGILIYTVSSLLLWYTILVFKPIIPNLCYATNVKLTNCYLPYDDERERKWQKHSCFVNFFTEYGFYEPLRQKQNDSVYLKSSIVWSTISLLFVFVFSIIIMNCSFGIYFNDNMYYHALATISTCSTLFSLSIQGLIFLAHYKRRKYDNTLQNVSNEERDELFKIWLIIIGIWITVGVVLFFVYFPYDGWAINQNFTDRSMARNIFFLVQGIPGLFAASVGIIYLVYLFGKCLRWCFCSQLVEEINNAKHKVNGFTVVMDENTPL